MVYNVVMGRKEFIGRVRELKALERLINSDEAGLAVVYGRRRVGKSFLLRRAFSDRKTLFFEGLEDRSKHRQIEIFIAQLHYQTGRPDNYTVQGTGERPFLNSLKY